MNKTQVEVILLDSLSTYGTSVLVILGAVLAIGVAYLVFKFGWRKINTSMDKDFRGSVYGSFNSDDSDMTYVGEGKRMKGKWRLD